MVRVQVPATTTNLGPGFECLGIALQLYNTVEMARANTGLTIEAQGEDATEIARDETNIVYKAAMRLFRQTDRMPRGLRIKLINNIPVAKGLGSSAAAVVGGLIAANILSGSKLTQKEILVMAMAMEGRCDNITPALLGGVVVSAATEGEIKYAKIAPPAGLKVIVVIPDYFIPTKTEKDIMPQLVNIQDAVFNLGRLAFLIASLCQGDLSMLSVAMEDRLYQPYRSSLVPGTKKVLAAARLAGARGVCLGGAGPSLLAFADSNFELIARVMRDTFLQNGIRSRTMLLNISPIGARALEKI